MHAQPQQIAFPGTRTRERFTGGGRSSVLPAKQFIQVGLICLVSHRSKCDTSESWLQVNWGTLIQGWLLEEYPIVPFSSGKQADANCTSPCRGKPLLHPLGWCTGAEKRCSGCSSRNGMCGQLKQSGYGMWPA